MINWRTTILVFIVAVSAGLTALANRVVGVSSGSPAFALILQWKCNEGSGTTVADNIGSNNATTNSDWTTSTQASAAALSFVAANSDEATSGSSVNFSSGTACTTMFWIKWADVGVSSGIMGGPNYYTSGIPTVFFQSGDIGGWIYGTGGNKYGEFSTGFSFSSGTWYHIAMVFKNETNGADNGQMRIYVNGVERSTTRDANTNDTAGSNLGSAAMSIGRWYVYFSDVAMDDIRFYTGEVDASTIAAIYAANAQ